MAQELQKLEQKEQEIAAAVLADFGDDDDIQIPFVKLSQPLTGEVSEGDASPGEFVNALTGENFGTRIEFIVAGFHKGRFRTDDDGEVICTGREGACGCHGGPYEECPDAEEQYRAAVKRGDKEWGSGPPCATTYNFTGYILGQGMPVILTLKRSGAKPARKWVTMLKFGRAPWDLVYEINSTQEKSKRGGHSYQNVQIRQGRKTEPEERQQAVALATSLRTRNVVPAGDETDPDAPPKNPDAIEY